MPPLLWGVLLLAACRPFLLPTGAAEQCSGGRNIFTEVPENSPHGTLVSRLEVSGDPASQALRLTLSGADVDWFYLDGKAVRLNTSEEKVLDREVLESPVLMVSFTCTEDGFSPVEYRIIVQVMNENDNKPRFLEDTVVAQNISELAALHSVVFSTRAVDADGDTLMYAIDSASADAKYFRIDLPNSGKIVLAKALDFETKRHLEFVVHAVEMNTKERHSCSARIQVNVMDGDDQYPRFLPCNFLPHDGASVCVSPVYTANITEGEVETEPLRFLPGAIRAEDGDRELRAPITYSILAGTDHGYFHMDNLTGAISLLRPVESSARTPLCSLSIMAAQVNDATKYAVTEARVRVLAANRHAPRFAQPRYQAFVHEGGSVAALVVAYSGRILTLSAADLDFADGFNPTVRYSLARQANHTQLFQVTPSGLLIARADHLRALERYPLQIVARDEESGESTSATVQVDVLWPGQAVPLDPSEPGHPGTLDAGVLAGSLGALLLVTAFILFLILRAMKKRQRHQQNMERAALAMEKHPNVSLKWFQPVNAGKAAPNPGNVYFQNEGYSDVGDEVPESYGGPALNAKPASARSEKAPMSRHTPVANSVGKCESQQASQARASVTPKEQEEGGRGPLPNGKTPKQPSAAAASPEEKGSAADPPAPGGLAAVQAVEGELPAPGTPTGSGETPPGGVLSGPEGEPSPEPQPQRGETPLPEAQSEGAGGPRQTPPASESPSAGSRRTDAEEAGQPTDAPQRIGENAPPSPAAAPPAASATAGAVEDSASLPAPQKEAGTPPPPSEEAPKETSEDEDDGEETPRATSPAFPGPLGALPVSDVRMPATLLQLLEDSIEC